MRGRPGRRRAPDRNADAEKLNAGARERLDELLTEMLAGKSAASSGFARSRSGRFRRYAPRMLRCLKLKAAAVAQPLVTAAMAIGEMRASTPAADSFLRPSSNGTAICGRKTGVTTASGRWRSYAFRRRYGDRKQVLVPMTTAQAHARLAVPLDPQDWLADRRARLADALKRLARAARNGTIPTAASKMGPCGLTG